MAATVSNMLPLKTPAPAFHLLDTKSGEKVSLHELKSSVATVIMFLCNHCPYVKLLQAKIVDVANHYQALGIKFIAISSNAIETHPQDGPDAMHNEALKNHYSFPYLYDETQEIAKAYQAACTPDFYIFDHDLLCIYRGRFDDATPGNGKPVTGADLCQAIEHALKGKPPLTEQIPSVGCNIKWRK